MKAPKITHFPSREWNVRAQFRSETSTSIRLPIVSSTDRGRFHPYPPVQAGPAAATPPSTQASTNANVQAGATSEGRGLTCLPVDPRSPQSLVGEDTPSQGSGSLIDPIESRAQSTNLESKRDYREQHPVQAKIDDNLGAGGHRSAEKAVEAGDVPVRSSSSNQKEPDTHVSAPGGSSKNLNAHIGMGKIPKFLTHPVVRKFKGASSGHTYVWYPSEGEFNLEYPPPIPRGATGVIPAGAIFRHINTRSGHIQRWVREHSQNDGQRWAELNEGDSYAFEHGTYVLSHNRTAPSWVTPESLRKKRYSTAQLTHKK
ncbi:hypothetical protein EST38_g13006 [Candolleomyces aberdarensis]|uniref:Uncharacterized protein n=1 Tax=Candolleomyces aberdarensis TaxID=2316362 RepID=A0A4Q2D1R8_9AGAR|nr:hypothetical protein EST38_g13006 [Candolleomyces aberdarensis]